MVGQLETVVMRLANLIIKSDGLTTPGETEALHQLQSDLSVALKRTVQAHESRSSSAPTNQAVPQGVRGKPGAQTPDRTTVQRPEMSPEQRFALAMDELNQLIGITAVKETDSIAIELLEAPTSTTIRGTDDDADQSAHGICRKPRHWQDDGCENCRSTSRFDGRLVVRSPR